MVFYVYYRYLPSSCPDGIVSVVGGVMDANAPKEAASIAIRTGGAEVDQDKFLGFRSQVS